MRAFINATDLLTKFNDLTNWAFSLSDKNLNSAYINAFFNSFKNFSSIDKMYGTSPVQQEYFVYGAGHSSFGHSKGSMMGELQTALGNMGHHISEKTADLLRAIVAKGFGEDDNGKVKAAVIKNDIETLNGFKANGFDFKAIQRELLTYSCLIAKETTPLLEFLSEVCGEEILRLEASQEGSGDTPAHIAAVNGDHKVLKFLASKGVNLGEANLIKNGLSPVCILVIRGHAEVLQKLIKEKVIDVKDMKDPHGNSLDFLAAIHNHPSVLIALAEGGVELLKKNGDGKTALDVARDAKSQAAVEFLERYNPPGEPK